MRCHYVPKYKTKLFVGCSAILVFFSASIFGIVYNDHESKETETKTTTTFNNRCEMKRRRRRWSGKERKKKKTILLIMLSILNLWKPWTRCIHKKVLFSFNRSFYHYFFCCDFSHWWSQSFLSWPLLRFQFMFNMGIFPLIIIISGTGLYVSKNKSNRWIFFLFFICSIK